MHELLKSTLSELTRALHERRASAVELMQAVLQAADESDEALNAWVSRRDPEALLADARAADARFTNGSARPLEGIPLGVKDLEDAAGLPTQHGSKLFDGAPAAVRDSTQVARLKDAGAILFGKTATPEFGFTAITKTVFGGATRSPWGDNRSPGGSSGGSAALLAAEVMPLVTGSDGGGSIRIPASFTGAFGLKTSYGRIPRGPLSSWDHSDTGVYGPISKTVEDAALFLDQVVGQHASDPKSLPDPGIRYIDALREPLAPLRLGVSFDLGYCVVQSDIARVFEDATRVLERLGHTLVAIDDGPPEMGTEWGLLGAYLLAGEHNERLAGRENDVSRALMNGITMARGATPDWWARTSHRRAEVVAWCAGVFDKVDALLTPTTPFDPPPASGPFPRETEGRAQPPSSAGSFTIPFNLSWHPAASVRAGLSDAALPVGMQIVAPHHRDDLALQLAYTFERERPWHPHWPRR